MLVLLFTGFEDVSLVNSKGQTNNFSEFISWFIKCVFWYFFLTICFIGVRKLKVYKYEYMLVTLQLPQFEFYSLPWHVLQTCGLRNKLNLGKNNKKSCNSKCDRVWLVKSAISTDFCTQVVIVLLLVNKALHLMMPLQFKMR